MKEKIIFVIIGLLIGLIIGVGGCIIYNNINRNINNNFEHVEPRKEFGNMNKIEMNKNNKENINNDMPLKNES